MTITAQLPNPRPAVEPVALRAVPADRPTDVVLDLVVPVYNEERALADSVRRLHGYLAVDVSLSDPDHHRRQREHRLDPGHRT